MSSVQHAPRFTVEEALKIVQTYYGLRTMAVPLPSERDQNFHVTTERGEEYVLKIASDRETREVLDFQHRAIMHIASNAPHLSNLRIIPTHERDEIATVTSAGGTAHYVRLLTYLPGTPLARIRPHTPQLLHNVGMYLGEMDKALASFTHPAMHRELQWDLRHAGQVIRHYMDEITDPLRTLVLQLLAEFETQAAPRLDKLRMSVIHSDGNDHNVLVVPTQAQDGPAQQVLGVIDFGDMVYSYTAGEAAVAAAYAMLGKADPISAAAQVIGGYHAVYPFTEDELAVLYPFIGLRLCLSVCLSAYQQKLQPENRYLSISEASAWKALEQLQTINPQLAHYAFRQVCGLEPCPQTPVVVHWLKENAGKLVRVIDADLRLAPVYVFDLSVGSALAVVSHDPIAGTSGAMLLELVHQAGAVAGIGRYNEARAVDTPSQSQVVTEEIPEQRTVHLGLDLFVPPGSLVYAPLDGVVHHLANDPAHSDFGPLVILEHRMADPSVVFYTLYGHVSEDSISTLQMGASLRQGEPFAYVGHPPAGCDQPSHLHFQIMVDMLAAGGDVFCAAAPSQRALWTSLCPDPNLVLQMPESAFPKTGRNSEELLAARRQQLGRSLSISYKRPLKIVRGWRQYLYDDEGRAYLDMVNNVCHVGHCHPRVVRAGQAQMAVLNTNTRYLHDNIVEYACRLTATFPEPLRVCYFVNSGSEANDLALRLARNYTGHADAIVVDVAYHGNLTSLIDISPYKHDGPGGRGAPAHVYKVIMPNGYRGPYKGMGAETGAHYAGHVRTAAEQIRRQGRGVAAFIAESMLGCGGQIVLPESYLAEAYRHVRAAGGICIADEVQVGFGRAGTHMWGFETQGVVPDIVTLGKPIGNGHPLGAVVTTPEIADAFANGMEYFNTFGGNPVSCAIGLAVLDVIEEEDLQAHALRVGKRLMRGLRGLMERYPLIGDVRGLGLFVGVELVLDRQTLEPAGEHASYIAERMRDHGILISTDGPFHNVLKLKPPLIFDEADADQLVATLAKVLAEDPVSL